jgi:hypothetical protein
MALVVGLVLCGLQSVHAEEESVGQATVKEKQTQLTRVRVPSQSIEARALYPDGKTPVSEASVKVWDVEDPEFVWRGKADKKGRFELPALELGDYLLIVADRVTIPLRVDKDVATLEESESIDLFVPHGRGKFAEMSLDEQAVVLAQFDEGGAEGGGKSWYGIFESPYFWGGVVVVGAGIWAADIISPSW